MSCLVVIRSSKITRLTRPAPLTCRNFGIGASYSVKSNRLKKTEPASKTFCNFPDWKKFESTGPCKVSPVCTLKGKFQPSKKSTGLSKQSPNTRIVSRRMTALIWPRKVLTRCQTITTTTQTTQLRSKMRNTKRDFKT